MPQRPLSPPAVTCPPVHVETDATGLTWSGAIRVARPDAPPLRVTGMLPGEAALVQPDRFGRAEPIEHRRRSPDRVDGRCAQLERCPGCPLRALVPADRRVLTDALHRRALGLDRQTVRWSRLPSAADDGGRSRAVARALRDADGRLVLGMARRGHAPIRLGVCPLQNDRSRLLLRQLEAELRRLPVEPWDAERRQGTLRHVIVHALGDRIRVILAVDAAGPPLPANILADRADVSVLVDGLPRRGAGLVHRPQVVRGDPWLVFDIGSDRFRAGPRSWVPQAPSTVPAVRQAVLRGLEPRPTDDAIELGCGIGLLSLPIARRVATLVGVDIERAAVLDAQVNAAANGVANARFRTGDAAHALRRMLARGARADVIVMHAMRRPFGPEAMCAVRALAPRRIVCLSPFAPALARDLAALPAYRPLSVALCDQTPGTVPDLSIVSLVRG